MRRDWKDSLLKLTRTEVCFFGVIFLVFPVLSGVEYNLYEQTGRWPSFVTLLEQVIYGVLRAVPYLIYYQWMLRYLFEKKYGRFIGCLVLFMVLLDVYTRYVVYGGVMHLTFLPESIVSSARKWFERETYFPHFSVVYVVRELLMITTLGYYRQSIRQEKQLHDFRRQRIQAELDSLKLQLQPHFFFNTLNNIYSLALQQSTKTAPLVARHADIMRYVLYQTNRETVGLQQEVHFLQNYVAVESVRYSSQITIQFDTQGDLSRSTIEPLLLLPFVENTFKHGIREEIDTGYIHILLVLLEQELFLETRNSKVCGRVQQGDKKGIGHDNARKRLDLLYSEQYELTIQETDTAYHLQLRITLRDNGELPDC